MSAEWIWLERWNGRSPTSFTSAPADGSVKAIAARWKELEADLLGYISSCNEEDLNRTFEYRNLKGQPFANRGWEMMVHVVNHGTYHRGQITTMLRQVGGKPSYTDLIGFYSERASQAVA